LKVTNAITLLTIIITVLIMATKIGYEIQKGEYFKLGIVTTTAAPAVNQFFYSYPLLQSMLSLDILALL